MDMPLILHGKMLLGGQWRVFKLRGGDNGAYDVLTLQKSGGGWVVGGWWVVGGEISHREGEPYLSLNSVWRSLFRVISEQSLLKGITAAIT